MKKAIIILAALFLFACGKATLEGKYVPKRLVDNPGAFAIWGPISFHDDGTGSLLTAGNNTTNFNYTISDDTVILKMEGFGGARTLILTVGEDGNLLGMGEKFVKQAD